MSELKLGDKAPEFSLKNQDGIEMALKDFKGKKVVLYFYPKDNTPGCTTEACEFSELLGNFEDRNSIIIGISPDNERSHENFITKFKLKHILLSDIDKEVSKAYGAWGLKKNYGKEYEGIIRSTFVIDEQGKISTIYRNVRAKDHAAKVLADLAKT